MYICICNGITDSQVRQCARLGAATLSDLQCQLGVAAGCGACADAATAVLAEEASCAAGRAPPILVPAC
jgi:bacterioferritin-associated ferredoxin